jgi:hypothetical protein
MRRRLLILASLGLAIVLAGSAPGEVRQVGNLRVVLDGGFSPKRLPRDRLAPVKVNVEGRMFTTDGSQPPPLRVFEIALNRHGRLSAQGLPTCRAATLQSASNSGALAKCRGALVGHGSFHAMLAFGTETRIPADGPVLVFNSRQHGRPGLLLHFYITSPVEATLVLPLRIHHQPKGEFGFLLRTKVPKLGGDIGSITGINLTIGRSYSYRGEKRSYLLASCAAPEGFSGGPFPFLRGSFSFAGNQRIDTTLIRNCHVR